VAASEVAGLSFIFFFASRFLEDFGGWPKIFYHMSWC
jgi:hypothetical protein